MARRVLPPLSALAALALVFVGFGAGGTPARADTLDDLDKVIEDTIKRLNDLKDLAGKDERDGQVDKYAGYTEEDFKNRKREVKAELLIEIIADAGAPPELRIKAKNVLLAAPLKRLDPDLERDRPGGRMSPLASLANKGLVKLLNASAEKGGSDPLRLARGTADKILKEWFKPPSKLFDIGEYDEDKEPTWKPAMKAWQNFLRTQ